MKKMTPDLCEDATSATRLVSVMLFLSADLSPEGLACCEHHGREREPDITRMALSPKTITAAIEI